jgi:hypothetical protein
MVDIILAPGWSKQENDVASREWTRALYTKTRDNRLRRMAESDLDDLTKTTVGEYINLDGIKPWPVPITALLTSN